MIVVDGDNAALCAAISSAERGVKGLVLEAAPPVQRGGKARHTRDFRSLSEGPVSVLTDANGEGGYFGDLMAATKGQRQVADECLLQHCRRSGGAGCRGPVARSVLIRGTPDGRAVDLRDRLDRATARTPA